MMDKQLMGMLKGRRKRLASLVALMLGGMLANIGITACICMMISCLSRQEALESILILAALAAVCIAVRCVISRAAGHTRDELGRSMKKELREKTYDKLIRLGLGFEDHMSMAGLTQAAMEGIEQLDLYFSVYIPQFFFSVLAPFLLFGICVWIDWRTALVLLACVPLIPASIIAVSKYAKRIFAKYWDQYISMGDKFLESVQGMQELKIFRADQRQHERMNENAEVFRKITMKVLVMQLASTTIMDLIAYGGAGIGIAVALAGVTGRSLPFAAGLFLVLVAAEFFLPLRAFGSAFHIAMNGVSAGKRILSLLEAEEPVWGTEAPDSARIELKDVTFSYDGQKDVLKNVSLQFPERGMSAIVGESGCGKSTIVSLICGMHRTNRGSVLAGGRVLEALDPHAWYSMMSMISCSSYVFHQSVRENFLMANPHACEQDMWEALEKVHLKEFIEQNGGLDKEIREDAVNLSGGQKQRLALAVSLACDKDIYVFDEATSNIDIESENIIMGSIQALSKTKSVIVISHRLANIVHADTIFCMADGQVREQGTHDELMENCGEYARLYRMQKALENGKEAAGA